MRVSDCVIRMRDSKIIKRFNVSVFDGKIEKCGGYEQAIQNQVFSGAQQMAPVLLNASQSLPSPVGVYKLAKTVAGVITITLPAPVAGGPEVNGDDGKVIVFINAQAQVNIISAVGLLLAVGVSKDTITFTAGLIGEFVRLMAFNGKYIVMDTVLTGGGTLA